MDPFIVKLFTYIMVPYLETFTKVQSYQQMFWKRVAFKNSENSNKGVNFSSIKIFQIVFRRF